MKKKTARKDKRNGAGHRKKTGARYVPNLSNQPEAPVDFRILDEPPKRCDKCGCVFIAIHRVGARPTPRIAQCMGSLGGCGKTWRIR